jgi:hypothetical protein
VDINYCNVVLVCCSTNRKPEKLMAFSGLVGMRLFRFTALYTFAGVLV